MDPEHLWVQNQRFVIFLGEWFCEIWSLSPPGVCSSCRCAFGDRCRANTHSNSSTSSSGVLNLSRRMHAVEACDERHNQQHIPPYPPGRYVWSYFHMLWTVPDSEPKAASYRQTLLIWRYFRRTGEQSSAVPCPTATTPPFYHRFPPTIPVECMYK